MPPFTTDPDFDALIPELREWNNGKGIDVDSWLALLDYEIRPV